MHKVYQLFNLRFIILCLFTWAELRQVHVGLRLQHYGDRTEYQTGSCVRRTFETTSLVCVFLFILTWPYSCTRHAGKQYEAAMRFPFFIVAQIGVFCTYITRERKMCLPQTRFMCSARMAPQYTRRNKWQCITSHPLSGSL